MSDANNPFTQLIALTADAVDDQTRIAHMAASVVGLPVSKWPNRWTAIECAAVALKLDRLNELRELRSSRLPPPELPTYTNAALDDASLPFATLMDANMRPNAWNPKGWTNGSLAGRLGCTTTLVSSWRLGAALPLPTKFELILRAFRLWDPLRDDAMAASAALTTAYERERGNLVAPPPTFHCGLTSRDGPAHRAIAFGIDHSKD